MSEAPATTTYYIPSYPQADREGFVAATAEQAVDAAESYAYEAHGEDILITDVTCRRRDTGRRDWVVTLEWSAAEPTCSTCDALGPERQTPMKATRLIAGRWYCFAHGMDIYCD